MAITKPTTASKCIKDDEDPSEKDVQASAKKPAAQEAHTQYDRIPGVQAWRRTLIWISLFFGILLSLMDTSIMATAIYTIALDFDSLAKAFWAILSYQLAYLGFAVVFARLSDFTGRSVAITSAWALFVGFSLACGWARNIDELIVFRTFQGIGGSGLYSLAIIVLVETSSAKLIGIATGVIGAVIALAGVLGPILGGVLTQYASWRWIFWINGPFGVFAVSCFILGWPHSTTAYDSVKRKWKEFDYLGAILILAASVLVVFGLQEAGTGEYGWNSGIVLGTLISGCLCWMLLVAWQYYIHIHYRDTIAGMFPITIITNRPLIAGVISTVLTGFSYLLVVVSLPLRFQIVNVMSPAGAGVHMLPLLCFVGIGGTIAGVASSKKNYIWQTFLICGSLILLGIGLLSTLGNDVHIESKCYGFQIILGLGVGATFSAVSTLTAVSTDSKTHSVAQGLTAQVRIFGGAIGVAASNAIFNAVCARQLTETLTLSQIQSLQTNTRVLLTLNDAAREAVRFAYGDSFRQSLRVSVYVAAFSLIMSAFVYQKNPPKVRAEIMVERAKAAVTATQAQSKQDVEAGVKEF